MPRKYNTQKPALFVAAIAALMIAAVAHGQTMSHPDSVSPMKPNPYLKHQDPWRWDIHTQVFLRAGRVVTQISTQRRARNDNFEERSLWWDVDQIEFIYPVVLQGGHYWSPNEKVQVSLRIGNQKLQPQTQRLQTPDSHAPYIWWRSKSEDKRIRQIHFKQISHVVCADTIFNEKLAMQIPWPDSWPEEAERFLTPIIDQIQEPIDLQAQDRLTMLVNQWMQGNDPRSIDQVTLAKFLTGKVIEHVRVGRGRMANAPYFRPFTDARADDDIEGFSAIASDSWAGYFARSADQVTIDPLGSVFDLSTMLTAVLRTAGVPARLLVCYDKTKNIDPFDRVRCIVEFAMYDKDRNQTLWIPIDPEKLKDHGRRSNTYKQPWEFFGTHYQLRNLIPMAYYFHPPVNYNAFGYPGLYGFKVNTTPGQGISPSISVDVINSPLRGDELIKNRRP